MSCEERGVIIDRSCMNENDDACAGRVSRATRTWGIIL